VAREISPNAVIIANAISINQIQCVYDAGADYVYLARFEAAQAIEKAIKEALKNRIEVFRNKRMARNRYSEDRKEVLR